MTLPINGQISMGQINSELGLIVSQTLSLNDPVARSLAGKASGQISLADFWGKSSSGSSGQYISGGPNVFGGVYFYGYSDNTMWGGAGSRPGPPQSIGTGGHTIKAILSDGYTNFIIVVTPETKPVGIDGKICRIKNEFGVILKDIPFDANMPYTAYGYYSYNTFTDLPTLSPAGKPFSCEII